MKWIKYIFKKINKKLRVGFIPSSGRNFNGRICVHHQGGFAVKKRYIVDFTRRINLSGFIIKILKTPFYTSFLGLILFKNGWCSYILLPDNIKLGSLIFCGKPDKNDFILKDFEGSSIPLSFLELFSLVSNVELLPKLGGQIARAAGTHLVLTNKLKNKKVLLKSKSGWNFIISYNNISSYGISSNAAYKFLALKKAGKIRALGIRPTVRGVAMNPCDHPHGGGEGRKSPPAAARSPWGWLTKNTASKKTCKQLLYKLKAKTIR